MASGQQQGLATSEAPPALQVQLLGPNGKAPTRGSAFAAGYDLYSSEDTTVPARGKAMVATSIAIAVPAGTCMLCPLFTQFFGLSRASPVSRVVKLS
jgi:dUTP pyrophosphatase